MYTPAGERLYAEDFKALGNLGLYDSDGALTIHGIGAGYKLLEHFANEGQDPFSVADPLPRNGRELGA